MKRFWIIRVVLFGTVAFLAFTFLTMYLWNWLVPLLFHGPVIEFWQAFGLLILGRLLFGGFGGGRCGGKWGHHHHWRKHWQQKMANMTPEEREELRKKWKQRCGPWYNEPEEEKQSS
jgi:hypothetical protein